ncbi:MAG: aminopeptidase [Gammaproteobacteria bacterium]|nr:aminopeptidase [Gammaproteobacteria bacterium]
MLRSLIPVFVIAILQVSGCSSLSYYSHLMNGHHDLIEAEEDIEDILESKKYDESTRQRLKKALEIRRFASAELGLPDNDSYTTFVKMDRKYPVWNVIAAETFSVKAKQWCFLIVGCINYRGYFKKSDAELKAKELADQGFDVTVSPAAAYSTLGWFDDPLLSSMLYKEEAHLAGIIFHELAHQKIYVDDDSAFNEAFATAVELEGVRRWLESTNNTKGINKYRLYKQRQKEFNHLLKITREKLKQSYALENTPPEIRINAKQRIINNMKKDYQKLKKQWGGYDGYDKWMSRDINNAHLALVATYHELVPVFERMLSEAGQNMEKFYVSVESTAELSYEQRRQLFNHLSAEMAKSTFKAYN